MSKIICESSDWSFDVLQEYDKVISRIAKEYLKLDTYPNQIEIVTSEQMLDSYSLIGLPISYPHWKFGKDYVMNTQNYQKGRMGLAYELVINSNPCISYNMEDNTSCLMALVLAHAAYGHNAFFKNNYMFKEWTSADSIIDYMVFARNYVLACEEKYGAEEVEDVLDACHALMIHGVNKYSKPTSLSVEKEQDRVSKMSEFERENHNDLWKTIPTKETGSNKKVKKDILEENILYFIEKNAPKLPTWKRELIRIVRKTAQYFYPQSQTKVINEGTATFTHYLIINKLYDEGYVNDGFMLEFIKNHTAVIYQPAYNSKYFSGINPYTLGFNIFMDIKRMCEEPTEEDRKWFPNLVGKDWLEEFHYAMENFRDDSFVLQYLSPKVMRDMRLFSILDDSTDTHFEISSIHNDIGYKKVREVLSKQYNRNNYVPDIQVTGLDSKDRRLSLTYFMNDNRELDLESCDDTLEYIRYLWGFPVSMYIQNTDGDRKKLMDI